jgi:hypothetical protein
MSTTNSILKEIKHIPEAKSFLDRILNVYSENERIACFYFDECVENITRIIHQHDSRFTNKQIRHACDVRLARFHRDVCCHIANKPKYRRRLVFKLGLDEDRLTIKQLHEQGIYW